MGFSPAEIDGVLAVAAPDAPTEIFFWGNRVRPGSSVESERGELLDAGQETCGPACGENGAPKNGYDMRKSVIITAEER